MMKMPTSANLVAFGFLAALAPQTAVAGSVVASPHRSLHVDAIKTSFLAAKNQSQFNPLADDPHFVGDKQCGVTTQVNSASNKYERCPKECPYYAQNLDDDLHCSFVCVEGSMCAELNPRRPIPDVIKGKYTCRGPMVEHCSEFNYDGTDTCAKCQTFYSIDANGHCDYQHWFALITVIILGMCGGLFGFIWLCDLIMRPICNEEEMKLGQNFRTRQKLHTPKDHNGKRSLYPLETNLCAEQVAGPGMLLHFNFQAVLMVWACWVATWWVIFAAGIDNALFVLGTRKFGTPRENCILVAWGYETQQRLMWTKVWFLIIIYISSFFMCMLHGIRQLRLFQGLDAKTKTMKDFVCFVTEIPLTKGSDKDFEKKLAKCIEDYSKQKVVGVSVCWNWKASEDTCVQALMANNKERETAHIEKKKAEARAKGEEVKEPQDPVETEARVVASYGALRRFFHNKEKGAAEAEEEDELPEMTQFVQDLESTEDAFVVFETEEERDEALKRFEEEGNLVYEGTNIELHAVTCEPDTVQWVNFGHSTISQRVIRLIMGFGYMCLGLLFWSVVFYAPYAWAVMSFNYDNGAQPPFIFAMAFTMVVVMGNAIMYEICARVSDFVGFKYRDDRESCYLILYVIACMFNVTLDFIVTFLIAWEIMKGLGFRTYHGQKLEEVEHFTDRIETYAMQRMLAENTFAYSFPATFLIPFLIEPFITIYFPLKAGELLVRTHPMITGRTSEEWIMAWEFDMGRYGDLLLNCLLGIIIFFFPGGYTYTLFYAMAFSHVIIYAFDHWRVLMTIPAVCYASMDVDWWAQWMFAPCVATIATALVMKANCQGYGYCIKGSTLVEAEVGAWFFHVLIHTIALKYLVPVFGLKDDPDNDPNSGKKYKEVAEELACSWFSANPIHCLRSQYVQEDKPHCCFWLPGKEHLQLVNPDIHCYFQDEEAEAEDFSKNDLGLKAASQRFMSQKFKKKEEPPAEAEQDK
jgi:hypothetical protein